MKDLENKVILVSKRKIDNEGQESFDTYFGKVKSFNENTVIVLRNNEEEESLPNGDDLYEEAEEGFYELNDGSTYEDPDFIAEFVVYLSDEAYQKYNKRNEWIE